MSPACNTRGRDILEGRDGCAGCAILRCGLLPFGFAYGSLMRLRRNAYRKGWLSSHAPALPTISIGNLAVGGTGKTPCVAHVVAHLLSRGRNPAVVARGYGAEAGKRNDEELLLRQRFPEIIHVADPDRCRGIASACERGADVAVLDDAFQHLRVKRNLDIVLIDATSRFDAAACLPAGILREPVAALADADVIILTRTDQADAATVAQIRELLSPLLKNGVPVLCATHRPSMVRNLCSGAESAPESLGGKVLHACSALARPDAFAKTLKSLGATLAAESIFADHHNYAPADFAVVLAAARASGAEAIAVSAKDAVKLEAFVGESPMPVLSLEIEFAFPDGDKALVAAIDGVLDLAERQEC